MPQVAMMGGVESVESCNCKDLENYSGAPYVAADSRM